MKSIGGPVLYLAAASVWLLLGSHAKTEEAATAETEHVVQAYLAMWSRNGSIDSAAVDRFYAPQVIYYGKRMSRRQVLADKRSYIRQWPVRSYAELPGTMTGTCNADRSRCMVKFEMSWRRVSRTSRVVSGRARLLFEFVQIDGGRKITRESARLF